MRGPTNMAINGSSINAAGEIDPMICSHREAPTSANMDSRIWSNMPHHILDHILAFLPFWSILQLQSVSRKWRSNLTSTDFLTERSKTCQAEVLFIMFPHGLYLNAFAAYNPHLNKWHLIPLSYFGQKDIRYDFRVIATVGGLLCMEEVAWPSRSLVVSNPINRSHRKLPPMLDMKSPYVVGMMMYPDKTGYRVLVAQDGESLVSQFYDSVSDSWTMNSTLESKVVMLVGMVLLGEFLFCLSFWPIGVVAYSIEEATWVNMQVKMPASINSPHLIHHSGQLLLVGGVEEYGQLISIRIWNVDLASKECVEIERMPDHFFNKFSFKVSGEHFSCMGEAGFVCFSDGRTPPILMYDMNEKRWWWLPPCPYHRSSLRTLRKHALSPLNPLGFAIKPCFVVKA